MEVCSLHAPGHSAALRHLSFLRYIREQSFVPDRCFARGELAHVQHTSSRLLRPAPKERPVPPYPQEATTSPSDRPATGCQCLGRELGLCAESPPSHGCTSSASCSQHHLISAGTSSSIHSISAACMHKGMQRLRYMTLKHACMAQEANISGASGVVMCRVILKLLRGFNRADSFVSPCRCTHA